MNKSSRIPMIPNSNRKYPSKPSKSMAQNQQRSVLTSISEHPTMAKQSKQVKFADKINSSSDYYTPSEKLNILKRKKRHEAAKAILTKAAKDLILNQRTKRFIKQKDQLKPRKKSKRCKPVLSSDAYSDSYDEVPRSYDIQQIPLNNYLDPSFRLPDSESLKTAKRSQLNSTRIEPERLNLSQYLPEGYTLEKRPVPAERIDLSQYLPEGYSISRKTPIEAQRVNLSRYLAPGLDTDFTLDENNQPDFSSRSHSTPNRVPRIVITSPTSDEEEDSEESEEEQEKQIEFSEEELSDSEESIDLDNELIDELYGDDDDDDSSENESTSENEEENPNKHCHFPDEISSDEEEGYSEFSKSNKRKWSKVPRNVVPLQRHRNSFWTETSTDESELKHPEAKSISSARVHRKPNSILKNSKLSDSQYFTANEEFEGENSPKRRRLGQQPNEPSPLFERKDIGKVFHRIQPMSKLNSSLAGRRIGRRNVRSNRLGLLEKIEIEQEKARHLERMLKLKLKYIKLNMLIKNRRKLYKN